MREPLLLLPLAASLLLSNAAVMDSSAAQAGAGRVLDSATQSWILQCQGCHRPSGTGTGTDTPPLAGHVASFLSVEGGREYLGRVPGVATAALDDEKLTELLNWTLYRFDSENIPADFQPYTVDEIARLRQRPLRTEAANVRAELMANMAQSSD